MRVRTVEAIPVSYPQPTTSAPSGTSACAGSRPDDGQVGWGEAVTMRPEASRALQHDLVETPFAHVGRLGLAARRAGPRHVVIDEVVDAFRSDNNARR